jgi:hypothetical protein
MAALQAQQISQQGLTPSLVAATSGGDSFEPGPHTFLYVKNGGGSSINVTVDTTATAFGEPISNVVTAVAAGAEAFIGPFQPAEVEQPGTGQADITYSAVTTVTIAVLTF